MGKDRRAGRRGLCGALAALLSIGVSTWAMAWDRPQWVRQLGTPEDDISRGGVATDGEGNVYICGLTGGHAFVAEYSRAGTSRWTRQLGTSGHDTSHGVATDGEGNVFISGLTEGALGGANQGGTDAFVAKYPSRR